MTPYGKAIKSRPQILTAEGWYVVRIGEGLEPVFVGFERRNGWLRVYRAGCARSFTWTEAAVWHWVAGPFTMEAAVVERHRQEAMP